MGVWECFVASIVEPSVECRVSGVQRLAARGRLEWHPGLKPLGDIRLKGVLIDFSRRLIGCAGSSWRILLPGRHLADEPGQAADIEIAVVARIARNVFRPLVVEVDPEVSVVAEISLVECVVP